MKSWFLFVKKNKPKQTILTILCLSESWVEQFATDEQLYIFDINQYLCAIYKIIVLKTCLLIQEYNQANCDYNSLNAHWNIFCSKSACVQ